MKLEKLNSVNTEVLNSSEMKMLSGGGAPGIPTGGGVHTVDGFTFSYSSDMWYETGTSYYGNCSTDEAYCP